MHKVNDNTWAEQEYNECLEAIKQLEESLIDKSGKQQKIVRMMLNEAYEKLRYLSKYCEKSECEALKKHFAYMKKKNKKCCYAVEDDYLSRIAYCPSFENELVLNMDEPSKNTDLIEMVATIVNQLPEKQKDVIKMCADGLTYSWIASNMNIKKGTVSRHLQDVRKKVRRVISNAGFSV